MWGYDKNKWDRDKDMADDYLKKFEEYKKSLKK